MGEAEQIVDENEDGLYLRQRGGEDKPAMLLYELGTCPKCNRALVYGVWNFMDKKIDGVVFGCTGCSPVVYMVPPDHYTVIRFRDGSTLTLEPGEMIPETQPLGLSHLSQ